MALSSEFFLFLLQHVDGEKINSFLDKPHYRLASKQHSPLTISTVLNSQELVAKDVNPSLKQLQVIYYLKNRNLHDHSLGMSAETKNNKEPVYHIQPKDESHPNRIILSRKRDVDDTNSERKKVKHDVPLSQESCDHSFGIMFRNIFGN